MSAPLEILFFGGTFGWLARSTVERMSYSLAEGTILALAAALLLHLVPRRNSGTRFAVWFSVLVATVTLPFFSGAVGTGAPATAGQMEPHSAITIPAHWALYIFWAWALAASLGLVRVAAGVLQVSKLRLKCVEVEPKNLGLPLQEAFEQFRRVARMRKVALCVSADVQVPTAIGFFKPAVVIPTWFLDEVTPDELRHVLLHELTHLHRRDDWTNLAQKVVKAILFFHPCVWWIERRLSLEREMACDDAVLAQTANPRSYAECLAHVAEKSFLRRTAAHTNLGRRKVSGASMVQAAVDRMRHLSLRVAQILNADRPRSTRLWRPAIPMVVLVSSFCVVSASHAPELVSFREPSRGALQAQPAKNRDLARGTEVVADTSPATVATNSAVSERPLQPKRDTRRATTAQQGLEANLGAVTTSPRAQEKPFSSGASQPAMVLASATLPRQIAPASKTQRLQFVKTGLRSMSPREKKAAPLRSAIQSADAQRVGYVARNNDYAQGESYSFSQQVVMTVVSMPIRGAETCMAERCPAMSQAGVPGADRQAGAQAALFRAPAQQVLIHRTVTQETVSLGTDTPGNWQVQMWELRIVIPANDGSSSKSGNPEGSNPEIRAAQKTIPRKST
ncbi:MAG TPA: M56 family metallopeptidase [Candidatus Angelobacter sp.]|nr:M56 family metallopeptidase [Candidatus Angelobacter sp.]